jgi:hypothetical protein
MTEAREIQALPAGLRKLGMAFSLWGQVSLWLKAFLATLSGFLALVGLLVPARQVPTNPSQQPIPNPSVTTNPGISPNSGVGLFLITCGVVMLAVSVFWSYRYSRWGRRLQISPKDSAPSKAATINLLRMGLGIDLAGMLLALMGGEGSGGALLIKSLSQFNNVLEIRIGPLDLFVVLVCIHLTLGQFIGIITSLYLLQRTTQPQR